MIEPTVNNVMANGELSNQNNFDLAYLASKMQGSTFNKKKFSGIVIRKSQPKVTVLFFRSGKFMVLGSVSVEDTECASRKLVKDINKILNENFSLKSFRVSNLVANGNLGYPVNIGALAQETFAYKDDKHAGVHLKLQEIKIAIVYRNGAIMLTGATSFENIQRTFSRLVKQLQKFKNIEKMSDKMSDTKEEIKQVKQYIKQL